MKYIHLLARWAAMAGMAVAMAVAGMVVWSIIARNGWDTPIKGDIELTQFGIAFAISLALPWCQAQRANIIVDFFTQDSTPRVQRVLDRCGALLLAVMYLLLAWRTSVGSLAVDSANETTMILGLPMYWVYASLAPGLLLAAVIALDQAVYATRAVTQEQLT